MSIPLSQADAVDELVAIGAAIGSNCEPCLEYHVARARELGAPDADIVRAVQTARTVKAAPARAIAKLAADLLNRGAALGEPVAPPAACAGKGEPAQQGSPGSDRCG